MRFEKFHDFFGKNKKLEETFKGPYILEKGNDNGTVKIKIKYAKHDQLVNQNLLFKYKQSFPKEIVTPEIVQEQDESATSTKRTF